MDYNPPGSSVRSISQARLLEWVTISFSRESSQPRDQTCISHINKWILYCWATRKAIKKKKNTFWRWLHLSLAMLSPWILITKYSSSSINIFFTLNIVTFIDEPVLNYQNETQNENICFIYRIGKSWVEKDQFNACYCCHSVAKLSPTICDTVDSSMPGFPVLH